MNNIKYMDYNKVSLTVNEKAARTHKGVASFVFNMNILHTKRLDNNYLLNCVTQIIKTSNLIE